MTESERPYDPPPEDEAPPATPDGPLTPDEAEKDAAYDPENEELKRTKGG